MGKRQLCAIGLAFWMAACGGSSARDDGGGGDLASDVPDGTADIGPTCRTEADCKALDAGPCGRVTCSAAGVCEVLADAGREGAACNPEDRCAVGGSTCRSGTCVPANRKSCIDRPCLSGRCDAASGECRYESLADGQSCDADANSCTRDQCVGGTCQAGPNACECTKDAECPAPGNQCLATLRCDLASHRCVPATEGIRCSQPADPCRVASCEEATGTCVERSLPDQTECEPSTVCNGVGTCMGGTCQRQLRCVDDDPCTEDRCDPTSGTCSFPPSTGGPCSDDDPCTVNDACANGVCVPGAALDCDDGNPCTGDACAPGEGCVSTPLDPATSCDDGNRCTTGDVCGLTGVCAGVPQSCDDGNPCTRDSCNGATGTCVHEALDGTTCDDGHACTVGDACRLGECVPGAWVLSCCEADGDCDDGDACTFERCKAGTCSWDGEPANLCGDVAEPCGPMWCTAGSGACETLDMRLPRRLVAWDLRAGTVTPGFRWSGGTGERRADGAGPVSGSAGASFRLPGRRIPAGLAVLVLDLGASACGKVRLYRDGAVVAADECRPVDGSTHAAWSWPATGAPVDLAVRMEADAVVARMDLYLWAQGDCPPLGPALVAEGDGYSSLASSRGPGAVFLAMIQGETLVSTEYSLDKGLFPIQVSGESLLPNPDRFSIALSPATPDGWLLAYGGVRDRTISAVLLADGSVQAQTILESTVVSLDDRRYEPVLAVASEGGYWIAWSDEPLGSSDLNVAITRGSLVNNTPVFDSTGTLLNVDTAGVQRRPRLATVGSGGVAAWISEQAGPSNRVILRRLDANGIPVGDEVAVDEGADALRDIALAPVGGDKVAWVAERDGGVFHAGIRSASDLSRVADVVFPSSEIGRRYSPDLVAFENGALLASVGVAGTEARVRVATLEGHAILGPEVPIFTPIERGTASPTLARLGPYWAAVAWFDGLGEHIVGVYLTLTAPTCIHGSVLCAHADAPEVCVGFGPTGYAPLPGATAWCL